MFKIKRDDLVEVRKGRERGKRGKVRQVLEDRVVVADVNIMKKHVKPGGQARQAGIIDLEVERVALSDAVDAYERLERGDVRGRVVAVPGAG